MMSRMCNPVLPAAGLAAILSLTLTDAAIAGVDIVAPASFRPSLSSLEAAWEGVPGRPGLSIRYVADQRLTAEIDGWDGDLVILDDPADMKSLAGAGLVDAASVAVFATDRLVLCAPAYQPLGTLQELAGETIRRVAIVNPGRGESGMMAVLALNRAGVWAGVQPKIVHADNSGEVLRQLSKNQAQAGLVYWSEASKNPSVRVVGTFERPYSDPIRYCSALSSRTREGAAAGAFQEWLASDEAQALLLAQGYRQE